MIDSGVALAALYPLCSGDEGRLTGKGWGLFDGQSSPGKALWRPLTYVFAEFGELLGTAPLQLPVTASPAEDPKTKPITALAGRSGGGRALKVLVASPGSALSSIRLIIQGLSANSTSSQDSSLWRYSVVLTNGTNASSIEQPVLEGSAAPSASGELALSFEARSPAVAFVRVEAI